MSPMPQARFYTDEPPVPEEEPPACPDCGYPAEWDFDGWACHACQRGVWDGQADRVGQER